MRQFNAIAAHTERSVGLLRNRCNELRIAVLKSTFVVPLQVAIEAAAGRSTRAYTPQQPEKPKRSISGELVTTGSSIRRPRQKVMRPHDIASCQQQLADDQSPRIRPLKKCGWSRRTSHVSRNSPGGVRVANRCALATYEANGYR